MAGELLRRSLERATTLTKVSWVLNAYNLAMVAFFLSMGRIADRYGQKRVFLGGIIVFTLFSLLCGFSPNIYWLIVFRVGQAVGGAKQVAGDEVVSNTGPANHTSEGIRQPADGSPKPSM